MKRTWILLLATAAVACATWFALGSRDASEEVTQSSNETGRADVAVQPVKEQVAEQHITHAASQTASFYDSTDLSSMLFTALIDAEGGDAEAMNLVARIYDYCSFYSAAPSRFSEHIEMLAGQKPSEAASLRAAGERVANRCMRVHQDKPISRQEIDEWLARAADAGSLSALVRRAASLDTDVKAEERADLVQAVARSRDPQLMIDASRLVLESPESLDSAGSIGGSEIDMYAWEIAACRMGAACQRGQSHMDAACLAGYGCNYTSYEELVRSGLLPNADAALLETRVGVVNRWIKDLAMLTSTQY